MTTQDSFTTAAYSKLAEWVGEKKIIYLFILPLLYQLIHLLTKHCLEYRADVEFSQKHNCKPPPELPYKWPLGIDRIKQIWDANSKGRLLAFFNEIADEYEPRNNLSQYLLLGPRAFHVLDPQNVEVILTTNFKDYGFGARKDVFAPLLGNGIFTQEGAAWRHSREMLRKQFVRTQYQNLDHFREHVDNLLSRLPEDGIVDLQPLFFSLTLDTTTALLFGQSVYSLRADIDQESRNKSFAESFNIAQEGLAKRFRIAPWQWFYNPPEFRQACSNVHEFLERYIEERNLDGTPDRSSENKYGFFNQVAEESNSIEDLRDQLLNVLLAGRDTTACCMSWTFRLLVRHPLVMRRLREEAAPILGNSEHPTRDQVKKLPYLGWVVKESLRLYPPVPVNTREATQTTTLPRGGGPDGDNPILVRKGEVVVFSQYAIGRRKNIYGLDAEEFRPERWETGQHSNNSSYAFFPFHGGPRQCLGEDFALMEVSYTILRLLKACPIISLPEGEKIEPVGTERQTQTLVLSSRDGCRVKVRKVWK